MVGKWGDGAQGEEEAPFRSLFYELVWSIFGSFSCHILAFKARKAKRKNKRYDAPVCICMIFRTTEDGATRPSCTLAFRCPVVQVALRGKALLRHFTRASTYDIKCILLQLRTRNIQDLYFEKRSECERDELPYGPLFVAGSGYLRQKCQLMVTRSLPENDLFLCPTTSVAFGFPLVKISSDVPYV